MPTKVSILRGMLDPHRPGGAVAAARTRKVVREKILSDAKNYRDEAVRFEREINKLLKDIHPSDDNLIEAYKPPSANMRNSTVNKIHW